MSHILELLVKELHDKIDGLESDLDNAVETAYRHGATEWVRLNYPEHYIKLSTEPELPKMSSKLL